MAKDSNPLPKNHRLAAALRAAKPKSAGKRGSFTSRSASKARRAYLETHPFIPTASMKVHKDCITLARTAWKNCHERVSECSQAIRDRALAKINSTPRS